MAPEKMETPQIINIYTIIFANKYSIVETFY